MQQKKQKREIVRTKKSKNLVLKGTVVSNKMDKTIVIEIKSPRQHPMYKKIFHKISKIKAHDEKEEAKVGNLVEIEACRPLSKEKNFKLRKILK